MDEYFLMLESYIYIFWPHRVACGILVPRPGIELVPPAGEVQSLNHWTAREVPWVPIKYIFFRIVFFIITLEVAVIVSTL